MKSAANVCKVVYYMRTAPRDMIEELVKSFDEDLREVLGEVIGWRLDDEHWKQAGLRVARGGLGVRGV